MAITERYVTASGTDTYANSTNSATPMSLATALANAVAGDRINIKAGTYTLSANFAPTNAGTVVRPIIWRGYNSTPGDLTIASVQSQKTLAIDTTNMPLIDGGANWAVVPTAYNIVEALSMTQSGDRRTLQLGSAGQLAYLCRIDCTGNSSNQACVAISSAGGTLMHCELRQTNTGSSSFGCLYATAAARVHGCRMRGQSSGTTNAACIVVGGSCVTNSILIHDSGIGFNCNQTTCNSQCVNCTIFGGNTATWGINGAATLAPLFVNCMLTDSGRRWNNANSGTSDRPVHFFNCRTRDNTNADVGSADWPIYNEVTTDTGNYTSDYIDYSGKTDYRLVAGSPGRGSAYPSYADMGALQRQEGTFAAAFVN